MSDLSVLVAEDICQAITAGEMVAGQRLPTEAELADHFKVSRSTVREALKRLAARALIHTKRGAHGGAFVCHIGVDAAKTEHATTAALFISMNAVSIETAFETRFALMRGCLPLYISRAEAADHARLHEAIENQRASAAAPEAFWASEAAFQAGLAQGAGNVLLHSYLAGLVEGMLPLLHRLSLTATTQDMLIYLQSDLADALENGTPRAAMARYKALEAAMRSCGASDLHTYQGSLRASS